LADCEQTFQQEEEYVKEKNILVMGAAGYVGSHQFGFGASRHECCGFGEPVQQLAGVSTQFG
jgi:hypothetical protein